MSNAQIHKYTNTAYYEVPERPNMWYIFEMRIVQRYQKIYFHVSNAQIQNKVPERLNMWYTFEKTIVQGYLLNLAQLYKVKFSVQCTYLCTRQFEQKGYFFPSVL